MEQVVAGSYDRFLFGFQCSTSGSRQEYELKRVFTHPAHKGPVKCVAAAAPILASGGADDLIHLYDLQAGSDLGFLMSPGDGAVSALAFHLPGDHRPPSHLLSGAADGSISVWQAGGDWICLKSLRGHKKEVSGIAVHPSGRLALSTSRDRTLRLWNLVKGKCAFNSALSIAAEAVVFSPSGNLYSLLLGPEVAVHEIGTDGVPKVKLQHPRKPQCFAYSSENTILTGGEDGAIRLWDLRTAKSPVAVLPAAHASRIRGISILRSTSSVEAEPPGLVASASSDGVVKLWDLRSLPPTGDAITHVCTNARLTCLTSMVPEAAKPTRRATENGTNLGSAVTPSQPAAPKSGSKKIKPATVPPVVEEKPNASGIVRDGVVEFPDDVKAVKKRRKKKGTSRESQNGVSQQDVRGAVQVAKRKGISAREGEPTSASSKILDKKARTKLNTQS